MLKLTSSFPPTSTTTSTAAATAALGAGRHAHTLSPGLCRSQHQLPVCVCVVWGRCELEGRSGVKLAWLLVWLWPATQKKACHAQC